VTLEKETPKSFETRCRMGSFTSAMKWHHLDDLWEQIKASSELWYVYAIGQDRPVTPVDHGKLVSFINEIDRLLRTEHDENYCGIVYADDLKKPTLVKIYDPNNLGVTCGYSDNPPLPGWVLSHQKPTEINANQVLPANRRRWWQKLFN